MPETFSSESVTLPEITSGVREILRRNGIGQLLAAGECPHLEGIWGSGNAATLAALLEEFPDRTALVVTPSRRAAEDLFNDLPMFSNARALFYPWTEDRGRALPDVEDEDSLATFIPEAAVGERLSVLKTLLGCQENPGARCVVAAPIPSLLKPCPKPELLKSESLVLRCGASLPIEELTGWLVAHGFQNTTRVQFPGEFFARGGLVDIFALEWESPLRVEFFGDEIDSIREIDWESQRSLNRLETVEITSFLSLFQVRDKARAADLTEYLPKGAFVYLLEPEEIQLQGQRFYQGQERPEALFKVEDVFRKLFQLPMISAATIGEGTFGQTFHLTMESVERFSGDFSRVKEELEKFAIGQEVFLLCPNEAEISRLKVIFEDTFLMRRRALQYRVGGISAGFRLVASHQMVLSSAALFCREDVTRNAQKSNSSHTSHRGSTKVIDAFSELREGDYVVHVSHGIAKYLGLKLLEPLKEKKVTSGVPFGPNRQGAEEHLMLEFNEGVVVYVPVSKIALVQKYINGGNVAPRLSTYGGKTWEHMKNSVSQAVQDLAAEMLDIQAERMSKPGIAFPVETPLQGEFDALFPYTETSDQLAALQAIRNDMHQSRPMDRLLCGDVGFGKTEVAMRAAFTAVEAGYQVGVMVPTTVLAAQHCRTFCQRMATFPVVVECISRFQTDAQQKEILTRLALGSVDILIGTHRIASSDIRFANLGLVIIDEEQRFGVEMKESLKRLRTTVDVLTMTATPIPRTLHMSLLGIRDISSLETPPSDRVPVETHVTRWQNALVRNAILRELERNGQIYFVHNRVMDIENVADKLRELVPEARIAVGHAQMSERELEKVMLLFINHQVDILVSTTIVENGLDIPNANTIFIDEANRYGLAELHQLRGRVGRFKNHAYCYLLVKEKASMTDDAVKRLKAIEEFSHLGAGFSIAMRDLEIRGTGNILGTKQSGQIAMVGYEMYCDLLEAAVRKLRRVPPRESVDVDANLPVTAYIPHLYVPDMRQKIELYRRLSRLTQIADVNDFALELEDRFGKVPPQFARLLKLFKIRILAHQWLIHTIRVEGDFVVFEFYSKKAIEPLTLRKIGKEGEKLRIVDEASAYLPLDENTKNSSPDSDKLLNYVEMLLQRT